MNPIPLGGGGLCKQFLDSLGSYHFRTACKFLVETIGAEAEGVLAGVGGKKLKVVQRWEETGAKVYSTDRGDSFLLTTDGADFDVEIWD